MLPRTARSTEAPRFLKILAACTPELDAPGDDRNHFFFFSLLWKNRRSKVKGRGTQILSLVLQSGNATHTNKKEKKRERKVQTLDSCPLHSADRRLKADSMLLQKEEKRRRLPDGHREKRGRRWFDRMFSSSMPALSEQTQALLPAGDGLRVIFLNWPLVMRLGILHKITEGFNPLSSEEPYTVVVHNADIIINMTGAVFLPLVT